MTKKQERLAVFVFGVVFVVVMLVLIVWIPNPTPPQYDIFKTVLALAAAGIAAFIPGFLEVTVSGWVRAGGALAVFFLVLNKNPASLVVNGPLAVSMGSFTSNVGKVVLDLGRITGEQAVTTTLDVQNLSPRPRQVDVHSTSQDVTAIWTSGDQSTTIPEMERRSLRVSAGRGGLLGQEISLREGETTLRDITIEWEVVPATAVQDKSSGARASGNGGDFGVSYPLCLGPAPKHYTLVPDSVRFWLTGDRTCGNWSHCDPVSKDDSDVCYSFSMQGHSENGTSGNSEGHLHAEYRLKPPQPALR